MKPYADKFEIIINGLDSWLSEKDKEKEM